MSEIEDSYACPKTVSLIKNSLDQIRKSGCLGIKKPRVSLLLDTDEYIPGEKRVGLIPIQLKTITDILHNFGVELELCCVRCAGERAGYHDSDFQDVGARIVDIQQLSGVPNVDVVHALKEPTDQEATIAFPFLRIGAFHAGAFDPASASAKMLKRGNFCAVFDGSNIGSCSYRVAGGLEIPIRGSMSIFAGIIAAEWVLKHLKEQTNRKVVVIGGGTVGQSSAVKLGKDCEVYVFDLSSKVAALREQLKNTPNITVLSIDNQNAKYQALKGAGGLILAPAKSKERAPKVVSIQEIGQYMATGSIVVDVAIDEDGAIYNPEIVAEDDVSQIKNKNEKALGCLNIAYKVETNMPRSYPSEASREHGKAILPYVLTLLMLCAMKGGPVAAAEYMLQMPIRNQFVAKAEVKEIFQNNFFEMIIQDLRNGLLLWNLGGGVKIDPTLESHIPDIKNFLDMVQKHRVLD